MTRQQPKTAAERALEELGELAGARVRGDEQIAMLLYPGLTPLDLVGPYHFLANMTGARVHLVTNQADLRPVASGAGLAIEPTLTMADCPHELTVLFVPGGTTGTIAAARDPATVEFIRDRASRARFVTRVCTGSQILGAAGVLTGRMATTHWSVLPLLTRFGAIPVNERVVTDGQVITGAGVSAGMDFGLSLVAKLRGRPMAESAMLMAEYAPDPPISGGTWETTAPDVARPTAGLLEDFVAEVEKLGVLA
jgi:putative intracellular protease/amidase